MKRWLRPTPPVQAVILIGAEEFLRHLTAGSSVIASILSSTTAAFSWEFVVALLFVLCRLVVLWLLPAVLVVWLLRRVRRAKAPERESSPMATDD